MPVDPSRQVEYTLLAGHLARARDAAVKHADVTYAQEALRLAEEFGDEFGAERYRTKLRMLGVE